MATITIQFEVSNESLISTLLQWQLEKQTSNEQPKKQIGPKKKSRLMMTPDEKKAEAPWGYKKDGTPKKRPGRKVA